MTLNTQHLVEWFPIYADATATKPSPRDVAGWRGQPAYGCCRSRWSQQPQSACGTSPACSTGQARLQERCWVCQAHPRACGVAWDAASLPVQGLSTSHSWQETRGKQGHHYICLHSDIINNFKLLWDSEVRKGIFHVSRWAWEASHTLVRLLFYWAAAVLRHMWVQCSENNDKKHLTGQLICSCPV